MNRLEEMHRVREATTEEKEHDCCGDRYPCNVALACSCGVKFCRQDMFSHLLSLHTASVRSALPATPQYVCENCDCTNKYCECEQPDFRCVNPTALPAGGGELPARPKPRKITPSGSAFPNDYYDSTPVEKYFDTLEAEVRRLREEIAVYVEHDAGCARLLECGEQHFKIAAAIIILLEKHRTAISDTRDECLRAVQEASRGEALIFSHAFEVAEQAIRSTGGEK